MIATRFFARSLLGPIKYVPFSHLKTSILEIQEDGDNLLSAHHSVDIFHGIIACDGIYCIASTINASISLPPSFPRWTYTRCTITRTTRSIEDGLPSWTRASGVNPTSPVNRYVIVQVVRCPIL